MNLVRLPPFPVVSDEMRADIAQHLRLQFSCQGGPSPGGRAIGTSRYIFGRGSDWSIQQHSLRIECLVDEPSVFSALFGPKGIVCRSASILLALEWTSSKSSRRGLSNPCLLDQKGISAATAISLCLDFGEQELLGDIQLSLQVFVGAGGQPAMEEKHLANDFGLRLGAISETWELVFDGHGSLFPIVQVRKMPTDAVWSFVVEDWEDATFDEFSPEFVSLEVNEASPAFQELYGSQDAPYSTHIFRQVLASWLLLFVWVVRERTEQVEVDPASGSRVTQWQAIVDPNGGSDKHFLPGSLAKAASELISRGNLDVSSHAAFIRSAQEWLDQRFQSA